MRASILIESRVQPMNCPTCQSEQILKNGKARLKDHRWLQKYVCKVCGRQFNERTGTPMSRLRSPPESLSLALNVRTEGLELRSTGRGLGKSHATIIRWEQRLAAQVESWSPSAAARADMTLEGDEVYTRMGENLPPLSHRAGQSTSLRGKPATGRPLRGQRGRTCLSAERPRRGRGLSPLSLSAS
jgi:transposase-like protein